MQERDTTPGPLYRARAYEHVRWPAAPGLEPWVEKHWSVTWDLAPGESHVQHVLTHPCGHLVSEGDRSLVFGVGSGRFDRVLEGSGQAIGTKFRPGALHAFTGIPMSDLTNRAIPARDAFGEDVDAADTEAIDAFLLDSLPEPDEGFALVSEAARLTLEDPSVVRVEDLADRLAVSVRTLQRLFRERVGVTPKWMLKRYRLHAAAERITEGVDDWAALALELGYFDQAHFIRDFKAVVGRTPADYAAAV